MTSQNVTEGRVGAFVTRCREDFEFYALHCLKILTKAGHLVPLQLNRPQRYLHERLQAQYEATGRVRALVLKGRQQGASTYLQARFRWRIKHRRGVKAYVLAHEQDASDNMFVMAKRYHENEPAPVRPSVGASNAKELWFNKLDSRYSVATAGSKEVGRSGTAQYMHASEAAFWPNAESHWAGIGQTVPDEPDTEVIVETTANGVGNEFHKRWLKAESGKSDYVAIFIPWFWSEDYATPVPDDFVMTDVEETLARHHDLSPEQIYWRRRKIENDFNGDETKFFQEYPSTAAEAFVTTGRDTLCKVEHIMAARKAQNVEARGPLVVGVDPARMGADRTAIVWRRGRVVTRIKTYEKRTTMQVAGIVANIIDQDQPAAVFIDIVGLGAGVYDRLEERGFGDIVVAVQAGEKASDEDRYRNKRAEMWDRMAKWLEQGPVQIPDADEVQTDLMCPGYTYDSHQRLVLESKEQILKDPDRRSPDIADALAMTFAEPVRVKKPKVPNGTAWGVIDELIGV